MDCHNNFTTSHSASGVVRKPSVAVIVALIAVLFAAIAFNALPGFGADQAHAVSVSNGAKVHTLKPYVTYTKYDVTGDRRPDTVRVHFTGQSDSPITHVVVNGRDCVLPSFQGGEILETPKVRLIVLKNKKPFLFASAVRAISWYNPSGLFQYKSGRFKKLADGNAPDSNYGMSECGVLRKVSGNKVVIGSITHNYTVGALRLDRTFVYKKGTLKRSGKTGPATVQTSGSAPTANKAISVYKNARCKTKKFTISRGSKVKFVGYYQSGKRLVLKVKSGGRTGWIKLTTSTVENGMLSGNRPFSNTNYRWS